MARGRKATILIEGKTIREISVETGIREATLRARVFPGCTVSDLVGYKGGVDEVIIDGMTLCEIAKATGIPKPTLYWRYRHGRADYESLTVGRYGLRITRERNDGL